jgi:uncharacterized phage-associated protein
MIEVKTIVQAIFFLLKKNGDSPMEKIKLVKLMYLSDKYHLLKYGRTITNDMYFAMPMGPVGSTVLNVLDFKKSDFMKSEYQYATIFLEEKGSNSFKPKNVKNRLDALSDTDKEALDFVYENFGSMETWGRKGLVEFTHKYPEWARYKDLFESQKTRREPIATEELLTRIPGDPFDISEKHIKESRAILREDKCL